MWKPAAGVLALVLGAGTAAAGPRQVCVTTEDDSVEIDGMLDDWDGVRAARAGAGAADASFELRCLYDGKHLYLAVDVRDQHVVRAGKSPAGEDRVELTVAAGKAALAITVFPGKDRVAPRRLVGGKPAPGWLAVEDTLQPRGWSAEVRVPLARVAGWGPSVPELSAIARFHDADVPRTALTESTVEWEGAFTLGNADSTFASLLADLKITAAQVTLDKTAELDPARPGPERVVAGGTAVALMGETYGYLQLPVAKAADVLKVELVDLTGDARRHVAVWMRQRGGGGTRDVLLLIGVANGKLEEVHRIEVAKSVGASKLSSRVAFESARGFKQAPRGTRRVLVVRAEPAVGWDEDTYAEAPSPDADPIHVPWDDDRFGAVYWLTKDGTLGSAPLTR